MACPAPDPTTVTRTGEAIGVLAEPPLVVGGLSALLAGTGLSVRADPLRAEVALVDPDRWSPDRDDPLDVALRRLRHRFSHVACWSWGSADRDRRLVSDGIVDVAVSKRDAGDELAPALVELAGAPVGVAPRGLSERQRQILELVAAGRTNTEIARIVWLSPWTVKDELSEIFRILGVENRVQAAALVAGGS